MISELVDATLSDARGQWEDKKFVEVVVQDRAKTPPRDISKYNLPGHFQARHRRWPCATRLFKASLIRIDTTVVGHRFLRQSVSAVRGFPRMVSGSS